MAISPGSTSRTKVAPTMSRAQVSEAKQKPPGRRPMASGRNPCGSRAANTVRSSMNTNENAPSSRGRTAMAAASRPSSMWAAISVATMSESVEARPRRPASSASAAVFTRFPLCPRARPRCPSVLNDGCALSQVVEPVVE